MNWKKLQQKFEENPLPYIFAAALLLQGAAKVIDASSVAQSRRAYAKQIEYKVNR